MRKRRGNQEQLKWKPNKVMIMIVMRQVHLLVALLVVEDLVVVGDQEEVEVQQVRREQEGEGDEDEEEERVT